MKNKLHLIFALSIFSANANCSEYYPTANDAVIAGIESIYDQSMQQKKEYFGCVYETRNGYIFGDLTVGTWQRVAGRCTNSQNKLYIADFHTHVPQPIYTRLTIDTVPDEFSDPDLKSTENDLDRYPNFKGSFVASCTGKILKYSGHKVRLFSRMERYC